jgi:hypothetical protein
LTGAGLCTTLDSMQCPSCSAEVAIAAGERIGFTDECPSCSADLHVCCGCTFYEPNAYNECRESSAERVTDRTRANRCEYFRPGDRGGGAASGARSGALAALDSLFGKNDPKNEG